jgi:hypothetical protein
MNFLYRLLLTFNATSLILVIFLIKEKIVVNELHPWLYCLEDYISYLIFFTIPITTTFLSLKLIRFLGKDYIRKGSIAQIEQANNAFLPSYLGYFFVALGVPHCDTLFYVFIILFVFTFLSQTLYFNPLFLVFGYHFYYLTTNKSIKVFVVTRKQLKNPIDLEFSELRRINNFTFIDIEN